MLVVLVYGFTQYLDHSFGLLVATYGEVFLNGDLIVYYFKLINSDNIGGFDKYDIFAEYFKA